MREFDRERSGAPPKPAPETEASGSSGLPDWVSAVGNQGVQQLARQASGLPDDLRDLPPPGLPPDPGHWAEEGHEQVSGSQRGGGRESWTGDVNPMEQGGLGGGGGGSGGGEQQGPVELPAPQGADEWEQMPSGGAGEGWEEMGPQGGNVW
jgi:hypothetical protein